MTTAVTWTSDQWGVSSGGVWADLAPGTFSGILTLIPATTNGGVVFDATSFQSIAFGTVGGASRPLDPPLLTALSLQATFSRSVADGTDNQVEVGLVPEAAPSDYATALLPWARSEVSLGTFTLTLDSYPTESSVTLALTTAAMDLVRAHTTGRANWSGRIALSLRAVGASTFRVHNYTANLVSAVTSQENFFSGLAGGPTGSRVRAVRDGRFGMAAFSTDLVEDGELLGVWVRPEDYDPEVEDTTRYRQRPGEGTRDDQIPD